MKFKSYLKVIAVSLSLLLAASVSFSALAVTVDEKSLGEYKVVSKNEWQLSSGVLESEIILNNDSGTKRQITHVVEVDINDPYTKLIPSTYKMAEGLENKEYKTQVMSKQAKYAEENGYGNVIAAMNTCLHWYDTEYYAEHPELIGEPLGTMILDGVRYTNSQSSYFGAYTCIVINYDEKDGKARPESIPKVQVRQTYDAITGWEEQLIPANFHFLVKDGVNQHSANDPEPNAPRTMMGIKADGTIVLVVVEGRNEPYALGFNAYEMAKYMISLGCVQAINCDGGGSSTFLSQRPGEELELHCKPSDGSERPVTHGVLVISTKEETHEHIPSEPTDKSPTSTESGYTNRVFCTICGEILEKGTEIPSIGGHNYTVDVANQKIVCDCGCEFSSTGLQLINGKTYYTVDGKLLSGWVSVNNDWYYFDKTNFAGLNGDCYADNGIRFNFDNGRVTKNTWIRSGEGRRCWYGPSYYKDTTVDAGSSEPYVIDGKTYLFNRKGYMQTGIVYSYTGVVGEILYYDCGTDGVANLLKGFYKGYFYEGGVMQKAYQLVELDGDYYFINDYHKPFKNGTIDLGERFTSKYNLPAGRYTFDAEGKMVINHGIVGEHLYIKGVMQKAYQLVEFEGDYYFINDYHKPFKNGSIDLGERFTSKYNLPAGRYTFDGEGKMVINHGVVGDYLYINGELQKAYQLVEFEGDYYFVNDYNKIIKNSSISLGDRFTSPYGIPAGRYSFDKDGKMILNHGVVGDYLYINGVMQKAYQLVEFEENYYFVNDYNKIIKNGSIPLTENFTSKYGLPAGKYTFDAEGKMVINNGVVNDYLYIDGVMQKAYQLIKVDGSYYFVNDYNKIFKNGNLPLGANFTAQYGLPAGTYTFDAEGKMIVKNGVEGDYLYINGQLQKAYQLVEFEGDYYFVNDYNKILKSKYIYLSNTFVGNVVLPDGSMLAEGYYTFDADGKMVLK
ncbi:MAG: phosphodiester glycosidase family protein [Clostridia bacterium]|nr:phosphodiester glycosidase family protein [Clostridia bacterium]